MSVRRGLLVVLVLSALLLIGGIGAQVVGVAQALPAPQEDDPSGITIPYPGQLHDEGGEPVAAGAYDFAFNLYGTETGGEPLWSEVQEGVTVEHGTFNVMLGSARAIPVDLLDGSDRWLAVDVRGPGEDVFTALSPRQQLSAVSPTAASAPAATSNGSSCPHTHVGEVWQASGGTHGLYASSEGGYALEGWSSGNIGVLGISTNGAIVIPSGMHGLYGIGDGYGVVAEGGNGGVYAVSNSGHSLYVPGAGQSGVFVAGAGTHGVHVEGAGAHGIDVASAAANGVQVYSAGHDGVRVNSAGWSGVYVASSGYDAIRVQTAGQDGLRLFEGMGRDYIRAGSDADLDFRVENDGTVRADGGVHVPADFAELMATEDAAGAYEPGDVLVISTDSNRSAGLSSEPYSTLVLGIYSTKPGFIGSPDPMAENQDGHIPVAIAGIAPCKVSSENGAIRRGDLLVTSATSGHAMRADDAPAGTILGKALEPLEEGAGIIQVLVTLQ